MSIQLIWYCSNHLDSHLHIQNILLEFKRYTKGLILVWYKIKLKSRLKQSVLGICHATPLLLMWKCTYWPLTSYRDNKKSNQLSPPWKLIGMDHSTLWPMVSFINICSPLKWFLSLFWNFADCLNGFFYSFTVSCSCCPYSYFGSAIMLVTYFVNFR